MKFWLLIVGMVASISSTLAVDYSYCQKQVNKTTLPNTPCSAAELAANPSNCKSKTEKSDKYSYYPFELAADGKIIPHPTVNYAAEKDREILEATKDGVTYKETFFRNAKGEITSFTNDISYKMSLPGSAPLTTSINVITTNFEIKNDKCIPSRVDTFAKLGNESRQDVVFDVHLCKSLKNFFNKNKDAAACFNPNYISQVQNIFKDYYTRNTDVYGEARVANINVARPEPLKTRLNPPLQYPENSNARFLHPGIPTVDSSILLNTALFATSPVSAAAIINANCSEPKVSGVTGEVLEDKTIWDMPTASSTLDNTVIKK